MVQLCTADLSFASAATYDIEMWAPGLDEWLEVSSCSNCTDFQMRRANIRLSAANKGGKTEFLHALNGSGLGLPRTLIAVLENYQQADGICDPGGAAAVHGRRGHNPARVSRRVSPARLTSRLLGIFRS